MAETPPARYGGADIRALSDRDLARVVDAAERAARSWRPVLEGDAFVWRGVTTGRDAMLLVSEARNALTELTDALVAHSAVVQPLGLTRLADTGRVLEILEAAEAPPPVPQAWLTSDDFGGIEAAVSVFTETVHRVRQAIADAEQLAGATWAVHRGLAETTPPIVPSLSIRSADASSLTTDTIADLVSWLQEQAQGAKSLLSASGRLASLFGMPAPMTATDVQNLCDLAVLACQEDKPEPAWLDASELKRAKQAAQALTVAVTSSHRRAPLPVKSSSPRC